MEIQQQSNQAPPPGYESALNAASVESPPSYESLSTLDRLKKAKQKSSNPVELINSMCAIVCGSFIVTILFAVSIALPITMIVIGSLYIDQCKIQRFIPIWLIVSGSFGCLSGIIRTATNCYAICAKGSTETAEDQNKRFSKRGCISSLIELFLLVWFITGNVWVYSISNTVSFNSSEANYCQQTCYLFAFWMITISWIMIGLFCVCCCCALCMIGFGCLKKIV